MICPSCGTANIEGADQCANCGHSLYGLDLPGGVKSKPVPEFVHRPLANLTARPLVKVTPRDPVGLAARLMQTNNTNYVLVMEDDAVRGIITGWDILQKVAGPTADLNAVTCARIMTPDPVCLQSDDSIGLAVNAMANGGFRHVPVLEGGRPVGVVTVNDVFHYISPHLV